MEALYIFLAFLLIVFAIVFPLYIAPKIKESQRDNLPAMQKAQIVPITPQVLLPQPKVLQAQPEVPGSDAG